MRIAVFIFDWAWKPLGHIVLDRAELPATALERDRFIGAHVTKFTDKAFPGARNLHTALAEVRGDEPVELTAEIIAEIRTLYADKTVDFSESWYFDDVKATVIRPAEEPR